jgi:RNA polymerase sigma-70 factor (ECF subfamily)
MKTISPESECRNCAVETALIESHQDIFRFLKRKLLDEHDPKDVLQEFYVRALLHFDDLKDEDRSRGGCLMFYPQLSLTFRTKTRSRGTLDIALISVLNK